MWYIPSVRELGEWLWMHFMGLLYLNILSWRLMLKSFLDLIPNIVFMEVYKNEFEAPKLELIKQTSTIELSICQTS